MMNQQLHSEHFIFLTWYRTGRSLVGESIGIASITREKC